MDQYRVASVKSSEPSLDQLQLEATGILNKIVTSYTKYCYKL